MHKHKQSQCKRKVKQSKERDGTYYILHNCVHCVYVCLLSEPEKRNICPAGMAGNRPDQRKKWILENQDPEGEIYMNGSKAGDVNPYFACMAALGLLAETKNCPILKQRKSCWQVSGLAYRDFAGNRWKMGIYRKRVGTYL